MEDEEDHAHINRQFASLTSRRNPKRDYRNANTLETVQWEEYYDKNRKPEPQPPQQPDLQQPPMFDPYTEHDVFRQETSELILDQFKVDFPSSDEMLDVNDVPKECHLESEIQRLNEARRRHSEIIRDQKDQELHELHQEMFLSFEESQVPDMIFPGEFLDLQEMKVAKRHDDRRCRITLTESKRLLELTAALRDFKSLPYDKLRFGERFPATFEEFRRLSSQPGRQRHVARYLLCDAEEGRKQLFTRGGLSWRIQDTRKLTTAASEDSNFREEVNKVISDDRRDEMDVEGEVPGLSLFNDK